MNNHYFEISDKYASVILSCFVKPNGTAIYTLLDGSTKNFKSPEQTEKWFADNFKRMKTRRRK